VVVEKNVRITERFFDNHYKIEQKRFLLVGLNGGNQMSISLAVRYSSVEISGQINQCYLESIYPGLTSRSYFLIF
jgi:hypothetical protein